MDEAIKELAETLALDLLFDVAEGERENDLDAQIAWYLYTTLAERGITHCLNN